jgi:ATP-binding cassette subfamily B protein
MGLESVFSKRNRAAIDAHVNLHATYIVISAMQRIAVETIMVCSIIFAGIWLSFSQVDLLSLAPLLATLGLFAARATPSISRLAANYNNIMHSLPYVETLIDMRKTILEYPQPLLEKKIKFNGDYAIKNISFGYDNETNILENVSLELLYGKVIIIVGESGSGKSTLLDLIVGLHPISKGEFELNGQPFIPFQCRSFSNEIGYVPQSIALFDATFSYNITLEDQPNLERLEYAIEAANLKPLISALPSGLETILGEAGQGVSGGQRQRIGIARALYRKPSFLVLDEITSALDASTGASVMKKLLSLRGKVTILLVTHDMSMIEHADLVYQIKDKKISQLTDVEKSTR